MLTPSRLFYCPETERGEGFTLVGSTIYAKKNRMHLRGVRMYAQGGECTLEETKAPEGSQMQPEGVK